MGFLFLVVKCIRLRADSIHDVLQQLLHVAQQVRAERLSEDRVLHLRDVYALCFHVARELRGGYPDVRIMVGDRLGENGPVQHHWIELPSMGVFVDPAYDELDSFQPVRAGRTEDEEFHSMYRNAMDSRFDVDDPCDQPEQVYRPRTAYDPERGTE